MASTSGSYYVPHGTRWPALGSLGLAFLMFGAAIWLNGATLGPILFTTGVAILVGMMFGWFGAVIGESQSGKYNKQVDQSYRLGMVWFIFSEVMFFAAFFGALFYTRQLSVPWLGGAGANFFTNELLWSGFESSWPTNGPDNVGGDYEVMPAMGVPAINTAILLTSGVTITIAHHALKAGKRGMLNLFLGLTVLLGFVFVGLQAFEYFEAYSHMNLKLTTGVYGSTFFMLTGFHGMHVTIGAIILTVILFRCIKGHFRPEQHFAFEAAAWYWHFVDVVWLGLFIFVYWL